MCKLMIQLLITPSSSTIQIHTYEVKVIFAKTETLVCDLQTFTLFIHTAVNTSRNNPADVEKQIIFYL